MDTKRKFNRINYLQNKYERMYDKGTYNKNQYKRFVHVVSSNYMMTRDQRNEAKHIIDNNNLRELFMPGYGHEGEWRAVVTAICFYVMKKDRRVMPYRGKFSQSVSLNKRIYDSVASKLNAKDVSDKGCVTYYLIEKVKSEAK